LEGRLTLHNLDLLEVAYVPHFGTHRDALNLGGALGLAQLENDGMDIHPDELPRFATTTVPLLDIRSAEERDLGHIPGARHIPATHIRHHLPELKKYPEVVVYCQIGSKARSVQELLKQNGVRCYNVIGGYKAWRLYQPTLNRPVVFPSPTTPLAAPEVTPEADEPTAGQTLDVTGLTCPGPIVAVAKAIGQLSRGTSLRVIASDPAFLADIVPWCAHRGVTLAKTACTGNRYHATLVLGP
jgi:rhodanese-related sulfurtransferase/TusA-related sulfurtransferase